jgi:Putative Flp pilus-assembly TadE/G-like
VYVVSALMQRLAHEQDGAMIVTVLFLFPVLIAFGIFVLDVANAFEHRRHLQLQADAGVLAAGQEFTRCYTEPAAANAAIKQEATDYSGASQNAQIGGAGAQARVRTRINSSAYDGADGSLGEPCEVGFIDLKLTDQDVPPIFSMLGLNDYHAHARLQVLRLDSSANLLPIAAEDPVPRWGQLIFVDESSGAQLATAPLKPNGTDGDLAIWDNQADPVSLPVTAEHIGVRVALSGNPAGGTCTDPMVACYDLGSGHGLTHIRGWSGEGSVPTGSGPPIARGVELYSSTCADPYFVSSACTIGVRTRVDFGVNPATSGNVTATVAGTTYTLAYDPTSGIWASGETIPVASGTGPVDVELKWEQTTGVIGSDTCKTGGGNKCTGTFGALQRTFGAAPTRSGPISRVQVVADGAVSTNSFQRCTANFTTCTHNFVVKVGIEGALELSEIGGPPVRLRIVQGSQNQSLDCDPGQDRTTLKDELWLGCRPKYVANTGTPCPAQPNDLGQQPWSCVAVQTGAASNQIAAGLNCRVLIDPPPPSLDKCDGKTDNCTVPNSWPEGLESGSPRIVYVIVTPFGSFSGNGSGTVPVLRMAAFYITGWMGQGGGFQNPCLTQGDEMPRDNAEIVGRFIKYVETPNEGGAGENPCDLTSVDICAAVLVE